MNKSRDSYLYRCFDGDLLLYVGISIDPAKRMKFHQRYAGWYAAATCWTWELIGKRDVALAAETQAICAEKPIFNIQKNKAAA